MNTVMIKCPQTGRWVSTGIDVTPDGFAKMPAVASKMHCPACGRDHQLAEKHETLSALAAAGRKGKGALQVMIPKDPLPRANTKSPGIGRGF